MPRGPGVVVESLLTARLYSIREFCNLQTPIIMFDKDGSFVVMKLEQVCFVAARTRSLLLTLWTVTPAFLWP